MVEDVVEGFEDPVREPVFAHELPYVFLRVVRTGARPALCAKPQQLARVEGSYPLNNAGGPTVRLEPAMASAPRQPPRLTIPSVPLTRKSNSTGPALCVRKSGRHLFRVADFGCAVRSPRQAVKSSIVSRASGAGQAFASRSALTGEGGPCGRAQFRQVRSRTGRAPEVLELRALRFAPLR